MRNKPFFTKTTGEEQKVIKKTETTDKDFVILNQNVQSIGNCIEKLSNFVNENNCKVVTISEHWKSYEQLQAYRLKDFKLVTAFCRQQGQHGGVAFYCQEKLYSKVRSDINRLSECYVFECAAAEVKAENFKYVIVTIYRTPDSQVDTFLSKMNELLDLLFRRNDIFVIAGDFNIDLKNSNNNNSQAFRSLLESYNVAITINDFTRINSTSQSCIDNILTNIIKSDYTGEVLNSHLSDHLAQKLTVNSQSKHKTKFKYVRCFNKTNTESFLDSLNMQDWTSIYNIDSNDVNKQWDVFMSIFKNLFFNNFPMKKVHLNQVDGACMSTSEIFDSKKRLSTLSVMVKYDAHYKDLYNLEKTNLENLLIEAKRTFYNNKIIGSDNVSKATWDVVERISGNIKKSKNNEIFFQGDVSATANNLNDYFVSAAMNLAKKLPNVDFNNNIPVNNNTISFEDIAENEILDIVKSLKNKNSSGDDEISNSLLKKCINHILKPFCYIINNSLRYGIFPDSLKLALVIPVYKSGDENNFENYRPINLLSGFSKIFEKVVYSRLTLFFEENKLFSEHQHGFLKGRSTETALFEYISEVLDTIDNNEIPLGIFLDLSKAYDTINHYILREKLERYGVRGMPLKWIVSYLSNRQQCVKITTQEKNITSEIKKTRLGVPQGSILGPLIFNIYINDLCNILTNSRHIIKNYADDTSLLIKAKTLNSLMEEANWVINIVTNWLLENKLILNLSKTNYVIFKTNRSQINPTEFNFQINKEKINFRESLRFLGVVVDATLTWSQHVSVLGKKLNSVCYSMRVVKKYVSSSVLRTIYYASFISRVKYGILFWGGACEMNKVFIIQKQALRIVHNLSVRESCRGRFRENRLLTVAAIYIYECLVFNFKYKHKFNNHQMNHSYGTRFCNNYNLPIHRLTMYEKGPCYASMKFHNYLPNKVKRINHIKQFKREIFNLLLEIEPYNINEFISFNHTTL